jgi:hypothetical protein
VGKAHFNKLAHERLPICGTPDADALSTSPFERINLTKLMIVGAMFGNLPQVGIQGTIWLNSVLKERFLGRLVASV